MKRWMIIFSMLIVGGISICSCSSHSTKAQRKAEKAMRKEIKSSEKAYQTDIKNHTFSQSPETRKMMKNSKRRAKKLNKKKSRESFFQKLF